VRRTDEPQEETSTANSFRKINALLKVKRPEIEVEPNNEFDHRVRALEIMKSQQYDNRPTTLRGTE
jgi:hypothetical protein